MKLTYYVNNTGDIFKKSGSSSTRVYGTTIDNVEYYVTTGSTSSHKDQQVFTAVHITYPFRSLELEIRVLRDPKVGQPSQYDTGCRADKLYEKLNSNHEDHIRDAIAELRDRCLAANMGRFTDMLRAAYEGGIRAGVEKQQQVIRNALGLS